MLSDRINSLSESATLAMAAKAREMQTQGIEVIKLNLGEPDFGTPAHINQAAKDAIDEGGYTFYTPVTGYPELRQGIVDKLKRDNGLDYDISNIVVSGGAKQSLANIMFSILNPDDEVIIFAPYWVTYYEQVKMAEGIPVTISGGIEDDFKVSPQQLKEAITPKTKAILFSSPCNPSGTVFTKAELKAIAEVVAAHENILVISDEIYEHINYGFEHTSIASFDFIKDRVAVVNGFSKGFAMTGWRVGYMAAPKWLAKACEKFQGQITSGNCSIAQKAAIAAITGDMQPTKDMGKAYLRRRDLIKSLLDEIDGIKTNLPQGAFYIFPDVSNFFGKSDGETTVNTSGELAMYLLREARVSVVGGDAFGADQCLRISFAASDEQITEAVRRIKLALEKLN